jgi:hypothetical protein
MEINGKQIIRATRIEDLEHLLYFAELKNFNDVIIDATEEAPHTSIIGCLLHMQDLGKNIIVLYRHAWLADLLQSLNCIRIF